MPAGWVSDEAPLPGLSLLGKGWGWRGREVERETQREGGSRKGGAGRDGGEMERLREREGGSGGKGGGGRGGEGCLVHPPTRAYIPHDFIKP